MFPELGFIFLIDAPLMDSKRYVAMDNKIHKECVRETLAWWHMKKLPLHFKQTNRNRYGHKPRSSGWKAKKRTVHHSITDLVASGETKRKMSSAFSRKISVGGTAATVLNGMLTLGFPFPPTSGNPRPGRRRRNDPSVVRGVSTKDMAAEISAWSPEDIVEAGDFYLALYEKKLQKQLDRSPKWRREITAAGMKQ